MERHAADVLIRRARELYVRGIDTITLAQLSLQVILTRVILVENLRKETSEEERKKLKDELTRLEALERWIALAYRALQFKAEPRAAHPYLVYASPEGGNAWIPY